MVKTYNKSIVGSLSGEWVRTIQSSLRRRVKKGEWRWMRFRKSLLGWRLEKIGEIASVVGQTVRKNLSDHVLRLISIYINECSKFFHHVKSRGNFGEKFKKYEYWE
jgi:hypothetical protein